MTPQEWPPKDPEEIITATYDFAAELAGAAILVGSPAVTVSVLAGIDPAPSAIKNGAPQISGGTVRQSFQAGVAAVDYSTRCRVDVSDGRRLVRTAILPVRTL